MYRLFTQYQRCYDALHGRSHPGADPLSLIYIRTEKEAVIGWVRPPPFPLSLPSLPFLWPFLPSALTDRGRLSSSSPSPFPSLYGFPPPLLFFTFWFVPGPVHSTLRTLPRPPSLAAQSCLRLRREQGRSLGEEGGRESLLEGCTRLLIDN
jgi:hypothetical protein